MDKDDIEEIGKEINDALEPEQLIEETDELRQQLDEERSILELAKIVQGLRASGKPSQKALFEVQLQICEKVRRFEETLPSPAPVVPRWQRNAPYTIWEESDDVLDKLGVVVGHDSVNYEEVSLRLIQEGIPENTLKAYRGDIRYIGAWLSL